MGLIRSINNIYLIKMKYVLLFGVAIGFTSCMSKSSEEMVAVDTVAVDTVVTVDSAGIIGDSVVMDSVMADSVVTDSVK